MEQYFKMFTFLEEIGEGGYGNVYKIKNKVSNETHVLKEVKIYGDDLKTLRENIKLPKHKNILKYYGLIISQRPDLINNRFSKDNNFSYDIELTQESSNEGCKYYYLLTEYCPFTLRDVINERNNFFLNECSSNKRTFIKKIDMNILSQTENENRLFLLKIFINIVRGVFYLHSKKIIHRDLKPENIFFKNNEFIPKIGDFGLCRSIANIHTILTSDIGTISYAAPETLGEIYSEKIDIYSLGLIYFELLCPFGTEMERAKMFEMIRNTGKVPLSCKIGIWEIQIIEECILFDSNKRLSARKLFEKLINGQEMMKNSFKK